MSALHGNYQVWGPPGCGKTTFIARQVEECSRDGYRVLLSSLTRAAAHEMDRRNMNAEKNNIGTLHKHCFHALGKPPLTEQHLDEFNRFCNENAQPCNQRIVYSSFFISPYIKEDLYNPHWDHQEKTRGDAWRNAMDCYRAKMIPVELWPEPVRQFHTLWENWKRECGYMDFHDLIEQGGKNCLPPGSPDVLIIDEAQDISKLEMEHVVKNWGMHTQAVLLVGDPYQCLYEWRGSSPDVFLRPDFPVPENHKKILSKSYRVPRRIYPLAMRWIKNHRGFIPFSYEPRDFEGKIYSLHATFSRDHVHRLVDHAQKKTQEGKTVMFLASCGFFLGDLIEALRERNIPFHNPYAPRQNIWNPLGNTTRFSVCARDRLLAYLRHDRSTWGTESRLWTFAELHLWAEVMEAKKVFRHGSKAEIERLASQIPDAKITPEDALNFFREENFYELDGVSLDAFEKYLMPSRAKPFAWLLRLAREKGGAVLRQRPQIIVGTIHSVKGGEADVVYLSPDLSPAGIQAWSNEIQHDSVIRQFYVAMTRAREELYLCHAQNPLFNLLEK